MRKFHLVLLGALFLGACNSNPDKTSKPEVFKIKHELKVDLSYDPAKRDRNIDAFFQTLHARKGFNGVVLIAKKGHIVYENAFGYANYVKKIPLTLNSRFQLASISKQFTALAIMLLKDEGKIKFDQEVTDFFPEFPYKGISIRMLLTHRSGLPNYQYFSETVWKDKRKAMTNLDMMAMFSVNHPPRWGTPDSHFLYNNVNYAVLAAIVEKVSGERLSKFMKDKVFRKLKMNDTFIYSKATDTICPSALIGYERSFRRGSYPNWLDGVVGDKGVYSTARDMFIWDQMLYTDQVINQKTLQEAFTGHSKEIKGHFNYGYGWRIFDVDQSGKIVYHTGWWHGFKNIFVRDIRNETTVVILSNLFNSSINDLDDLYSMLNIPPIRQSAY